MATLFHLSAIIPVHPLRRPTGQGDPRATLSSPRRSPASPPRWWGSWFNLAVFFAWHLLWPAGTDAAPFTGGFQWFAAVVSVTAFVALAKFKRDVLEVIGACAGLELCYTFATG